MGSVDQAEELRRLEELYARMSDGELEAVAGKVDSLTEIAQRALLAEISRRGLEKEVRDARPDDSVPPGEDLVDLWRAKDPAEARLVKSILDSAGVASCLAPDDLENVDTLERGLDDEVRVRVVKWDVGRALNALAPHFPHETQEDREYVSRCPSCHSPDIVFQGLDAEPAEGSATGSKFNWTCDACGHQWKDAGLEEES